MTRLRNARGSALIEAAFIVPLVLFIAIGIIDFGRAYETMQVLTNAAREGARVAILAGQPAGAAQTRVQNYLLGGGLTATPGITVAATNIDLGGGFTAPGSQVTVTYPFSFFALQPVASLVVKGTLLQQSFTMTAVAAMRNEQ
jgi:Flp pilus assembly protein TadG